MSALTQHLEELKSLISLDLPANQFVMESMLYVPKQFVTDAHLNAFTYYLKDEIQTLDGQKETVQIEVNMYEERDTHYAFHRGDLTKLFNCWPMMNEPGMLVDLRPVRPINFELKMKPEFEYRIYEYLDIKPEDLRSPGNIAGILQRMTNEQGDQILGVNQRDCLLQFMDPNVGGIFKAFPGFGKTVVMCVICASMGLTTLLLARKTDLLDQFEDKMRQFTNIDDFRDPDGYCYKMYRLNKKWSALPPIATSTYQYLSANPDFLHMVRDHYSIVIADECHRLGSETGTAIFLYFNCLLRMGFSATPFRRDGIDILFGDIIGPVRLNLPSPSKDAFCYMVDTGINVPGNYANFQFPMNAVHNFLAKSENRNAIIARDAVDMMEQGRFILILTYRIKAIDDIWYAIQAEIWERARENPEYNLVHEDQVSWIYANTTAEDRASLNPAMVEGRIKAVITTAQLFSEGSDVPILDTLFQTYPTADARTIEQIIGRITREYEGKPSQIIRYYRDGGKIVQVHGMGKGWAKNMTKLGIPVIDSREEANKLDSNRQALFGPKKVSPS